MAELVRAGHTLEIHRSGLMHPAVQTLVYHWSGSPEMPKRPITILSKRVSGRLTH